MHGAVHVVLALHLLLLSFAQGRVALVHAEGRRRSNDTRPGWRCSKNLALDRVGHRQVSRALLLSKLDQVDSWSVFKIILQVIIVRLLLERLLKR